MNSMVVRISPCGLWICTRIGEVLGDSAWVGMVVACCIAIDAGVNVVSVAVAVVAVAVVAVAVVAVAVVAVAVVAVAVVAVAVVAVMVVTVAVAAVNVVVAKAAYQCQRYHSGRSGTYLRKLHCWTYNSQ